MPSSKNIDLKKYFYGVYYYICLFEKEFVLEITR